MTNVLMSSRKHASNDAAREGDGMATVQVDMVMADVKNITTGVKAVVPTKYDLDLGALEQADADLESASMSLDGAEVDIRRGLDVVKKAIFAFGSIALIVAIIGLVLVVVPVRPKLHNVDTALIGAALS
jgi:hypothetical protein